MDYETRIAAEAQIEQLEKDRINAINQKVNAIIEAEYARVFKVVGIITGVVTAFTAK